MLYKLLPIVEKEIINNKYFILTFSNYDMAGQCYPGQFFRLKNPQQNFPILPRPFSIHNVYENKVSFLIKKVGTATIQFSAMKVGQKIALLGPLGNGFTLHQNKKILIVSGGIGYAPFPFLVGKLNQMKNEIFFFHGGKTAEDIFSNDVIDFTEDGSIGEEGLVTDGIEQFLQKNQVDVVYACGPQMMLKKVTEICKQFNIDLQVSLETIMACGIGVCCGCTIRIIENGKMVYKKVCKDGTVFDGYKVVWNE
ncbi:MAG: dihydroorotate dehydrogenase electron transfer subunit [Candidatus Cloacimonadota bacterium]|nr:dihydroorotate dehydrogenase electron transfer subunit [Candidatus Cloacimonadota bacterium]